MGQATNQLNSDLSGNAELSTVANADVEALREEVREAQREQRISDASGDVSALRSQMEDTREEMSGTIDALQAKLDPQKVKAQVAERVHEATVERAQQFAQVAKTKVAEVAAKACEAISPAIQSMRESAQSHDGENGDVSDANGWHSAAEPQTGSFLKPISQQVVVVFGASSGIGRETAIQFARAGAKVVVAARGEDGLSTLVDSIHRAGGDAAFQVADVTDLEQVKAVAQKAVEEYGRIDTWVHCAAITLYATAEETTSDEFRRVLEVNLLGTMHGALAALPHLKREGQGALICISSVEGKRAFPYQSAYASSKHGIIGFLDTLRMELQHEGANISVTNVMPAGINTPFFNHGRTKLGVKPQPAPPIYQPSVVAETILHAAEHPTRDICAGGAAKMMTALQRISPALTDVMVKRTGFKSQRTKEPMLADSPDNWQEPMAGYNKIGGDFMTKAKGSSIGTWLETHPAAQRAIKGAAVGLAVALLLRRR